MIKISPLATIFTIIIVLGLIAFSSVGLFGVVTPKKVTISSYQDCVRAGFPILETYPSQCKTPSGQTFIEPSNTDIKPEKPQSGPISLTGTFTCLPHKNTSGPITLECAFGLKTDDGLYYGLDMQSLSDDQAFGQQPDIKITVTGTLKTQNDPKTWEKYNIAGVVLVSKIAQN